MTAVKLGPFLGLNNKAAASALPIDKCRNAVNVLFADNGEIRYPRPGMTRRYSGVCHSVYMNPTITLFVEAGSLKQLNANNTATTLKTGVGSGKLSYTAVGETIYFANGLASGKIKDGVAMEWGVQRPPRNPDCMAVSYGGLFAGDYRVVITWLGSDGDESGCGNGTRVTVAEGGGIHLTNFPAPPAYVTGVAVYVSSVNGKDLLFYTEYPATANDLTVSKRLCTLPLATQFGFKPLPEGLILAHYGRIYFSVGKHLFWTESHRYGLQRANSYWVFDSDIKTVVSCPTVLYVGTLNRIYKITNIDSEEPAIVVALQACGTVKGSETPDPDGVSTYVMSARGFLKMTPEGIEELSYKDVAIPHFSQGASNVTEINGVKYLTFVGQGGTQNPLADKTYSENELSRSSL